MLKIFTLLALVGLTMTAVKADDKVPNDYHSGSIDYTIKVGEYQSKRVLMSFFALPAEKLQISVSKNNLPVAFSVIESNKTLLSSTNVFEYTAPNNIGHYDLIVQPTSNEQSSIVRVFVMRPATEVKNEWLNGYRIGSYPKKRLKNLAIYDPPLGFVEVKDDDLKLAVSPHYTLGQFLSKQGGKYPKYLVLKTRLLRKLEYVTDLLNARGIRTDGLHIMSGFRTPYYNAAIKNTLYSRHQWGGASDVFVDENPKDNQMDDLNGDGKRDIKDAKYLAKLIEERFFEKDYQLFVGGLGLYESNSAHGPFVHIDVRGTKARW